MEQLGFCLDLIPPNTVDIRGFPPELEGQLLDAWLEKLLEEYKWCTEHLSLGHLEAWARSLAKRAANQRTIESSNKEMDVLVDELFAYERNRYTPSGMRIWVMLSLQDLNNLLV